MATSMDQNKESDNSQPPQHKRKNTKKGRLIIRNLSFKSTEEKIKEYFSKYGEIVDVNILKKPDGKLVGCAFVQFSAFMSAAKALKELNAKPFLGRPIAVDWAVPKDKYSQSTENNESEEPSETNQNNLDKTKVNEKAVNVNNDSVEDQKINEENESEEDGDDDDNEDDLTDLEKSSSKGDDSDEVDEDSEEKEEDSESEQKQKSSNDVNWKGNQANEKKSDVNEGKTIFVRNLDFSTTQSSLKHYMEQFGEVQYALLCMDKILERPKGTGFVKFKDAESAKKCLEEYTCSSLFLDGRTLNVMLAVSREDVAKQVEERKHKPNKDNRNLYLAREGYIRPGTLAAEGVSNADMLKRQQNESWKKQMLRNLHMFISRERLCVHNLPPKMNDQQLKKLFVKHSPKGAKISEARIMRDMKSIIEGGMNPSKGYGFVTFTRHEDALQALRNINNNPNIFTNDRRPIVEFSVENRAALNARQHRTQKSRENIKKTDSTNVPDKVSQTSMSEKLPEFSGAKSDPKIKGLPSHSGPKIRHKKRPAPSPNETASEKKPKIRRKMLKSNDNKKKRLVAKETTKQKEIPMTTGPGKSKTLREGKGSERTSKEQTANSRTRGFGNKTKWFDS